MIVVDASVVASALIDRESAGSNARSELRAGNNIAAPDLLDIETVSALRGQWLARKLTLDRFRTAIDNLADLPIDRHPALPFLIRTYQLRDNLTPYDALYVALAEALGCPLITADVGLATAPGPRCEIRLLQT
ncbi:MAG: type II toxin-antitoxin system VapC family toxin [Actinomycetia bacterium]|nr:type II toxin-antitoxin system VapC family toxin [Actinomycetes bacterium]